METPTLEAESIVPCIKVYCEPCSKQRRRRVYHYHGNENNYKNRITHRIAHCENYPNGYNIAITDNTFKKSEN